MSPPAMTSTSTTEARQHDRRSNLVPLLLSSFPVPPSHIPASPFPSPQPIPNPASPPSNPPLSLPPSAPLPPVPGPSPVTERETLMFISAARSRRASKISLASSSSYSRRDSTATIASVASGSSVPSPSPFDSASSRSLRSFPSASSLSVPVISRHQDKSPKVQPRIREESEEPQELTRLSLADLPRATPSPAPAHSSDDDDPASRTRQRTRHRATGNDSISSIDMRDLPPLQEDEPEPLSAPAILARPRSKHTDKDKALPPLPPVRAGAESPDINTILASTPRPRRKSSGSVISSRSRSLHRHASEGMRRRSARSSGAPSELAYAQDAMAPDEWNEDSFIEDYGVPLDKTGTPLEMFDADEEARFERALEGDGSDSDSSLDIHTPLPNLMLRDGLLSPNSKLLPAASGTVSPQPSTIGGRGSVLSVASTVGTVMTKNGLYKDQRDTQRRRTRHRDGKLLKGGIGLTTGLGWSDSEDEDAPSPLTRQLSSHSLARKSLPSSLHASPLARSFSDVTPDSSWMGDPYAGKHSVAKGRASLPSVPSPRRTSATSVASAPSRASVSSVRSSSSLRSTSSRRAALGCVNERDEAGTESPSSTSSSSAHMPPTPSGLDDFAMRSTPASFAPGLRKGHPGLPNYQTAVGAKPLRPSAPPSSSSPAIRASGPRPLRLPQAQDKREEDRASRTPVSRSSTGSSTSETRPRAYSGGMRAPSRTARPNVPSDSSSYSASPLPSPLPTPSPSSTPTRPGMPASPAKRPRTGTGMTYRTTSGQNLRPSMMRMPSSTVLRASAAVDVGAAK